MSFIRQNCFLSRLFLGLFCNFLLVIFLVVSAGLESCAYIDQLEQKAVQPGLIHHRFLKYTEHGPVKINILEVDLKHFHVRPALADSESIWKKENVLEIVKRNRAVAGINANYFERNGAPIGALAIEREWIISPVLERATFSSKKNKEINFARPSLFGKISTAGEEEVFITSINQPDRLNPKGLSFYNHWWEKPIKCGAARACLLVNGEGTVELKIEKYSEERKLWPTMTEYLLSCREEACLANFQVEQKIQIKWLSKPDLSETAYSVGGGPYLLREGKIVLDKKQENFTEHSGIDGLAPRTAIGVTEQKRLILLTADGRQKDTVGLSLLDLAKLMKELGITEAINLDGGGSTTMVLGNQILNKPSNQNKRLRKVSIALLLFKDL